MFLTSDHRVCLADLGVLDSSYKVVHQPKSLKFYILANLFAVLKNIIGLANVAYCQKHGLGAEQILQENRCMVFELIRSLLDIAIGWFHLLGSLPAKQIAVLGTVSSLMAIMECEKMV